MSKGRGRGRRAVKAHELRTRERVNRTWIAGVPFSQQDSFRGRLSKYGGNLVLTNRRLLFEPLKGMAPKPRGGDSERLEPGFLIGAMAVDLSEIASVEPFSFKGPPRLKLTLRGGDSVVLGVMKRRSTTIWGNDTSDRDEAVEAIAAAAARAVS